MRTVSQQSHCPSHHTCPRVRAPSGRAETGYLRNTSDDSKKGGEMTFLKIKGKYYNTQHIVAMGWEVDSNCLRIFLSDRLKVDVSARTEKKAQEIAEHLITDIKNGVLGIIDVDGGVL